MNTRECGAVVKFMLAGFPAQRQRMSLDDVEAMTAFYFAGLRDIEADVAKAAIERIGKTAKFIPTVAEIREAVGVVHHGEQSPAVIAWGEVHGFMRSKGAYRQPGVDFVIADPLGREVVRSIGWEDMCTGKPDHIRARFMDGYAELAKLARREAQAAPGGRSATPISAPHVRYIGRDEREGRPRTLAQLVHNLPDVPEDSDD